jgi:periplasmic protein TonB
MEPQEPSRVREAFFSVDRGYLLSAQAIAPLSLSQFKSAKLRPNATLDELQVLHADETSPLAPLPSGEGNRRSNGVRSRHLGAFAASIAAHAAIVGMIVMLASPVARTHSEWVLAYVVEVGDGAPRSGGASAAAPQSAAPMATTKSSPSGTPRQAHRRRHDDDAPAELVSIAPRRAVASSRPHEAAARPAAASDAAARGAAAESAVGIDSASVRGGAGSPGAAEGGAGAGPDSLAHADYARNPRPMYPASARRRAQEGTVTIRVLVGADGAVEHAELAESSGVDALDDAALATVRSRWRFIPARRDGVAVESWVLVPIQFALVEANADRGDSR